MKTDTITIRKQLHETALKAPSASGVYLWRNEDGEVIYVGKAKNLKNRLTSYFSGQKDIKTRILVSRASTIEYITTANEYEAFILENNLIKKHTPRYNINLKDGKSYPVLRITNEDYPRLFKTRRIQQDGSRYFGPFPDVTALDTFIETLYQIYPVRHCKQLRKRDTPCMYYHIGRCAAPCCGKTDKETYNEYIVEIAQLLEGKGDETLVKLKTAMSQAAKELKFEKAARLRDGIAALNILKTQNIVEDFDPEDRDYIAYHSDGELVSFTVLRMRGGKLLGRDNYRTKSLNEENELLGEFLAAYYTAKDQIPPRIFVPTREGLDILTQYFSTVLKTTVHICLVTPEMESGKRHQAAMNMAFQNAKEDIIRRVRERGDIPAMQELQQLLKLPHLPIRIEGFDIAHIGGKLPVASLISFYNGNPDKKNYRYFRLKTTDGIIDDFASMREAVSRRYTRLLNEQAEFPDLILIDGGIGQVNAVESVLSALHLDIPVIGLAKQDEEIYLPGRNIPISLPKRSDALRLLQRVRDETHRFATSKNQRLRTTQNTHTLFEKLPNVGPIRARKLIKKYITIKALADASNNDVAVLLHISQEQAEQIITAAIEKQYGTKRVPSQKDAPASLYRAETGNTPAGLAAQALQAAEQEESYS